MALLRPTIRPRRLLQFTECLSSPIMEELQSRAQVDVKILKFYGEDWWGIDPQDRYEMTSLLRKWGDDPSASCPPPEEWPDIKSCMPQTTIPCLQPVDPPRRPPPLITAPYLPLTFPHQRRGRGRGRAARGGRGTVRGGRGTVRGDRGAVCGGRGAVRGGSGTVRGGRGEAGDGRGAVRGGRGEAGDGRGAVREAGDGRGAVCGGPEEAGDGGVEARDGRGERGARWTWVGAWWPWGGGR